MNGTWRQTLLGGKTADIYDLAQGAKPRFGVLFLHPLGLETLVDRTAYTRLFDELKLVCLCPHVKRSWWTDRVCPDFDPHISAERHVLDHVLPFFRSQWHLTAPAIGILGISMGGQGALRLAFRHPQLFPVASAIASALDYYEFYDHGLGLEEMYDSKEQCRQDTALMHLPPYNPPPHIYFCIDPEDADWVRGNDRLHEKMNALGVAHTADLTTLAGGHTWVYFNHMAEPALRFVNQGLEKESRRLL